MIEAVIIILILGLVIIFASLQNATIQKEVYSPVLKNILNDNERELLNYINRHRVALGLNIVIPELLACDVCEDAVNLNTTITHQGFNKRGEACQATDFGEICAMNYNGVRNVFSGYLASSSHKACLERADWTHCGISYVGNINYIMFTKYE